MNTLRRLIVASVTVFFLMGCSHTVEAVGVQKLGGNPAVMAAGSTLGKTEQELVRELGSPEEIAECGVQLKVPGGMAMVSGKALGWSHEYGNAPEGKAGLFTLATCLVKGTAVAESRSWQVMDGEKMSMGQTQTIDRSLVRDLLKQPSQMREIPSSGGPEFEI